MHIPDRIPIAIQRIPAHDRAAAYAWVHAHYSTGAHVVQMLHDDDCRALTTQRDADCDPKVCRPDFYLLSFIIEPGGGSQWN